MGLVEVLKVLRNRLSTLGARLDEASTKQTIVLPVLQSLGWGIFDPEEVCPEFSVGNRKVDYCLKLNGQSEVFIEVKRVTEDLDDHQEQLLEYAFRQGIALASLTNGVTWHFYLPMKKGSWTERKFYTIDLLTQEPEEVADRFRKILSKEQVESGLSVKYAEEIYKGKLKEEAILEALPKAWNTIISGPDELLVDLLAEITEKTCGFKPEEDLVISFIKRHSSRFVLDIPKTPMTKVKLGEAKLKKSRELVDSGILKGFRNISELSNMGGTLVRKKPKRLKINEEEFEVGSWAEADLKFITYLVRKGILTERDLPIHASDKKYFVNSIAQHSSPDFNGKWEQVEDKFWVDVKYNAPSHIRNMLNTLEKLGVKDEVKVLLMIE
ncbi:MAG TPA: hypothetical protein ENF32_03675 [Thermosulfidibacter takaii]|uniref:Uncharacterized protein n=1 Tax=Thermosulfidibacter takaii TaxID=412593 RepID=A0A7C0U698_9BACT|nr:hypothetical protein [Thermosulfidibacter takaii]